MPQNPRGRGVGAGGIGGEALADDVHAGVASNVAVVAAFKSQKFNRMLEEPILW